MTPIQINEERLNEYRRFQQRAGYSNNTCQQYFYYAKEWLGHELNQRNVDAALQHKHSIQKRPTSYRAFLKGFVECFGLGHEIIIRPWKGRMNERDIDYFTSEEMKHILRGIQEPRLHLIIRLMFELGLRISEIMALKKNNFDMVNRAIRGQGKGNKEFRMPIFEDTCNILQEYLKDFSDDDYVFHFEEVQHQRQKAHYEIKKRVQDILPYKNASEIYPHAFRHTAGTLLREKGFDLREIQTILRHSTLSTVVSYTAVDNEKLREKWEDAMRKEKEG